MCELLCALSLTPVELEKNRLDCHETRVRIFLFPVYCSSSLNKRLVWLASNEPSLNEVKNKVRVWFSFEPVQAPYLTSWFLSQILSSVGNWIWIDTVQRLNETTHRLSLHSNSGLQIQVSALSPNFLFERHRNQFPFPDHRSQIVQYALHYGTIMTRMICRHF